MQSISGTEHRETQINDWSEEGHPTAAAFLKSRGQKAENFHLLLKAAFLPLGVPAQAFR